MPLSLPVDPPHARSLTGVVTQMSRALDGRSDWFAPATSAIVFVIDGLGAANLAARSGHARFLTSMSTKKHVARTVFPSTTASALTSLLTGSLPGEHGIVGYRARVPGTDRVANQLRGWE
ncbi:MAG: alkaline phosphatase family protein, partial [Rhodococcus sp. (in: high G+C Gram-positive bacteria)]